MRMLIRIAFGSTHWYLESSFLVSIHWIAFHWLYRVCITDALLRATESKASSRFSWSSLISSTNLVELVRGMIAMRSAGI